MSKFKLEVGTSNTTHKSGVSKAGKDYSFYEQDVYVYEKEGDLYPRKIQISFETAASALQPGKYVMDLTPGIYFNRFGNPEVDMRQVKFIPDTQASK